MSCFEFQADKSIPRAYVDHVLSDACPAQHPLSPVLHCSPVSPVTMDAMREKVKEQAKKKIEDEMADQAPAYLAGLDLPAAIHFSVWFDVIPLICLCNKHFVFNVITGIWPRWPFRILGIMFNFNTTHPSVPRRKRVFEV